MDALMRIWGAVAALGAALIALAVGAAAAPWIAVPVLAAGAAQAALAVVALRGRRLATAAVVAPLLTPTVVWLVALTAAPAAAATLPLGPMLAETALGLGAAALLAARRHRVAEPKPLLGVLALLSASAVVATVATTAISGTRAGDFAQPHGEHGTAVESPATGPAELQEHDGH